MVFFRSALHAALILGTLGRRVINLRVYNVATSARPQKANVATECEEPIQKFGTDTIGRLMGAEQCGVEQTQIQLKDNGECTLTSAAKRILCQEECGRTPELAVPLGNLEELQQRCTDEVSIQQLQMSAAGHAISAAIWDAWSECHTVEQHVPQNPQIKHVQPDECKTLIEEQGASAWSNRLMPAMGPECGVEVAPNEEQVLIPNPETVAGLCSPECQALPGFQVPLMDIDTIRKQCSDASSEELLETRGPAIIAGKLVHDLWSGCTATTTTTTTIVATIPVDDGAEWVDFGEIGVYLEGHLMSCGPTSDRYIEGMLELLHDTGARIQQSNFTNEKRKIKRYTSCMASCVAVFSKFSECARQDDSFKCSGLKSSVVNIGPSGKDAAEADRCTSQSYQKSWVKSSSGCNSDWLQKPKQSENMFCSSLYDSRKKASGAASWKNAVAGVKKMKLQGLAAKHHINFGTAPKGMAGSSLQVQLDCRKSWCMKVDNLASYKSSSERTLASCEAECEARNAQGL